MLRLEPLARGPVLPVIAAGEARRRIGRRRSRIPARFTDAENLEVDRRRGRHPQRIEVHPAVSRMVAALRTKLARHNDVGRSVDEVTDVRSPEQTAYDA